MIRVLRALIVSVAVLLIVSGGPAKAESLQERYDTLFQQLLQTPDDLRLMAEFANVATRLGNYESAITVLQRMLMIDPRLTRARLELGVLYYRLGSHATASLYLNDALAAGDLSPKHQVRARAYLDAIGDPTARSHLHGEIFAGIRYQTNANFGPSSNAILAEDFIEPVPAGFGPRDDFNGFISGHVGHEYDFGTPLDEGWISDLGFYYSHPVEIEELTVGFVELDTGPQFALLPHAVDGLSFRPFAEFRSAFFDHDLLYLAGGGGVELAQEFEDGSEIVLSYLALYKNYNETAERPNLNDQTGVEHEVELDVVVAVLNDFLLLLDGSYIRDDADTAFQSNDDVRVEGGFLVRYDAPFGITPWPWEFVVKGGIRNRYFDAPNPDVDPTKDRNDMQYRVTGTNRVRVSEDVSIILQGKYVKNDSNLPNFDFENIAGTVAAALRF